MVRSAPLFKLRRLRCLSLPPNRHRVRAPEPGQHQHLATKSVAVAKLEQRRLLARTHIAPGGMGGHLQHRLEQVGRDAARVQPGPQLGPLHRLDPLDPGLAPPPAFDHALKALQRMKAITVELRVTHPQCRLEFAPHRQIEFVTAVSDRQGRPGHERNLQRLGPLVHRQPILPDRPQVLVVEDGSDRAAALKRVGDLVEKPSPGVQHLAQVIRRIAPMLAHREHPGDRQLVPPQGEGPRNAVENGNPMFSCQSTRHVTVGELIDIHRDQLEGRPGTAGVFPAPHQLPGQHIGVRPDEVLREDGGHRQHIARRSRHRPGHDLRPPSQRHPSQRHRRQPGAEHSTSRRRQELAS